MEAGDMVEQAVVAVGDTVDQAVVAVWPVITAEAPGILQGTAQTMVVEVERV